MVRFYLPVDRRDYRYSTPCLVEMEATAHLTGLAAPERCCVQIASAVPASSSVCVAVAGSDTGCPELAKKDTATDHIQTGALAMAADVVDIGMAIHDPVAEGCTERVD